MSDQRGRRADPQYRQINANLPSDLLRAVRIKLAHEDGSTLQGVVEQCLRDWVGEQAVTLADLLPEGCNAFRFTTPAGILRVALQHPTGSWEVTGLSSIWSSVNDLQRGFDIDLNTVVPLTVHPDWIEAQR